MFKTVNKLIFRVAVLKRYFFLSCPPIPVLFFKFKEYCMGKVKGFAHHYNSDYKTTAHWR